MDLKEAINRKDKLEADIKALVLEFETATNLKVMEVNFFRNIPYTGGYNPKTLFDVTVKVEI